MPPLTITPQTPLVPLTSVSELITFLQEQYDPDQGLAALLYDPEVDAYGLALLTPVLCGSKLVLTSALDASCILENPEGRSPVPVFESLEEQDALYEEAHLKEESEATGS